MIAPPTSWRFQARPTYNDHEGRREMQLLRRKNDTQEELVVTTSDHACAVWIWRCAVNVADDPVAIELMLRIHALRAGGGAGYCVQCGVPWPCVHWRIATLALTLPSASTRLNKQGSNFWFGAAGAAPTWWQRATASRGEPT